MKTLEINVEDEVLEQVYSLLRTIEGVKNIKQQDWEELSSSDPAYLKNITQSLGEDWDSEEDKDWDKIYKNINV